MSPPVLLRGALVLATTDDAESEFITPAAEEAVRLLGGRFQVVRLIPSPDSPEALTQAVSRRTANAPGGSPLSLVAAFTCSHGSSSGLVALPGGPPVFDITNRALFAPGTFLVINACMKTEQFPEDLLASPSPVAAVIGYRPNLAVVKVLSAKGWLHPHVKHYQDLFCQVLTQPIRSLLQLGCTARQACEETSAAWETLDLGGHLGPVRLELQRAMAANAKRVYVWGDPMATLL